MTTPRAIVAVPAPPHPSAPNTAARYYAALLKGLAKHGAQPRVLSLDDGTGDAAREWLANAGVDDLHLFEAPPIRRDPLARARRLVTPYGDAVPQAMKTAVREALHDGFDVLHVEEVELGRLTSDAPASLLSVLRTEARDALAGGGASRRALRAERTVLRAQRALRTLSPELVDDLRRMGVDAPIDVIPLALDLDAYDFRSNDRPAVVGLIGSMFWPPTRAAALRLLGRVWPLVRQRNADAELLIAGWRADTLGDPPLGARIVADLSDHREFFDQIGLLAFPIPVGSGMKVKVMESMALGVPVVTTPAGVEGFPAVDNHPWWTAESDEEFAQRIDGALRDPAGRRHYAQEGRALLERYCSPKVVAGSVMELHRRLRGRA